MLKAAAERGWLNEKDAVLEALLCLKRAGSGEPVRQSPPSSALPK
jgi:delta-aminolevulinic acid dehydratase/porphobilinogen synthase